jgi:two-component system response regulator FixJ
MDMVVGGMANKAIAAELGLSEKTIEVHRKHVMDKMQAGNVADLIRMAMSSSHPVAP